MKHHLLFTVAFAAIANLLSATPYITIGELKLFRAYAPEDSQVDLREYLPAGETFERWSRLASVRVFKDLKDPKEYLSNVAAAVSKSSPAARYQFLQNDKTKEYILDFMTFAPDSEPVHFAEWNLMRAKYVKKKGLIVYQYAMRFYEFGESTGSVIRAERNKMTQPFNEATFEENEEPNQSPEPTPTAGTSAAEQPLVPAAVVAVMRTL